MHWILPDFVHLDCAETFLAVDSIFRTTSLLDDSLHALFYLIFQRRLAFPVIIPTFHVEETEAQRSQATLSVSHTQVCLTLES